MVVQFVGYENNNVILKHKDYLEAILNCFNENNIEMLHEGRFKFFINEHFTKNIEEILPIIDVGNKNSAFQIKVPMMYNSLFGGLIQLFAGNSYELDDDLVIKNFNFYKSKINDFDKAIDDALEKVARNNKDTVEFDIATFDMLVKINEDIVEIINRLYQKKLSELKNNFNKLNNHNDLNFNKSEKAGKLLRDVGSTVEFGLLNNPFKFDISKLDIKKDISENWVYILGISMKIKSGYKLEDATDEQINYLQDILNNYDSSRQKGNKKDINFNEIEYVIDCEAMQRLLDMKKIAMQIPEGGKRKGLKV